jgi:hypothetical protein
VTDKWVKRFAINVCFLLVAAFVYWLQPILGYTLPTWAIFLGWALWAFVMVPYFTREEKPQGTHSPDDPMTRITGWPDSGNPLPPPHSIS